MYTTVIHVDMRYSQGSTVALYFSTVYSSVCSVSVMQLLVICTEQP